MLIDWFTVFAQIVNFLILVWLLKHFLYGRIIKLIDAREAKIAARLAEAEEKKLQSERQLASYEAKLEDLQEARGAMLIQARQDADKQHAELLEAARQRIRVLEAQWREDLERTRQAFLVDLRRRAATETLAVARRAVADLACKDLEECAAATFLQKLRALDREAWNDLAQDGQLTVRSAFDLSEATRAEIQNMLDERLHSQARVRFDRAPGVSWGLEVIGHGRRVGWNCESYFDALEQDLKEALERQPETEARTVLA